MRKRNICVLGATGSIGENTLDVIARNPDRYRVVALPTPPSATAASTNVD